MDCISRQVGFPARPTFVFKLNGRRIRVQNSGVETLKLLLNIRDRLCQSDCSPVRVRELVKRVEYLDCRHVLAHVIERTSDPGLRTLAIWLRGRCRGKVGISGINAFRDDVRFQTRKEVARALQRMGAWSELREMAATETDPRIKRVATVQPPKPYATRLANLTRHLSKRIGRRSPRELFVSPEVDFEHGRPPKSVQLIRMILKRIHTVLAGK